MKIDVPNELKGKVGVYQIINTINQKSYIGSTKNFRLRYNKHKFELSINKHPNKHLQNSFNKHGGDNFVFKVIYVHERLEIENEQQFFARLLAKENELINQYNANGTKTGFNLRISAYSNYGITHSESALTRIKGKKLPESTKLKMSINRTGEKHHSIVINDSIAKEIKILIALGFRNQNIADYFNLSKSVVNDIKNNGSWKHININHADIDSYIVPTFSKSDSIRLNSYEVVLVKILIENNIRTSVIADFLEYKPRRISDIKCGKVYNHVVLSDIEREKYGKLIDFEELKAVEDRKDERLKQTRKKSGKKGSSNNQAKLTEAQVIQIRDAIFKGDSLRNIASEHKVTIHAISKIKTGDNWQHITGFQINRTGVPKGINHPNFKHSKETVLKIHQLTKDGLTTKEICHLLCLEKTFVNRVKSGKIKRD